MERDLRPHASERREADLDDAELAQRRHVRAKADRMGGRLNDLALDLSTTPTVARSGLPQILLTEVDRLRRAFAFDPPDLDAAERAIDRLDLFAEALTGAYDAVRVSDPDEARAYVLTTLLSVPDARVAELLTARTRHRWRRRAPAPADHGARAILVAQLLLFLRLGGTPEVAVRWFSTRNPALDGRTPLALLDEDLAVVRPRLTEVMIADISAR